MKFPVLPDKVYTFLKWFLIIVIPAFELLLTTLTKAWGWNIPLEAITITITAFQVFFGTILGISTKAYNKTKEN